jgi:hypothetical protein
MPRERLLFAAAAAIGIAATVVLAGLVLAPAKARQGLVASELELVGARLVADEKGSPWLVLVETDAARGSVAHLDGLTRVSLYDARTGEGRSEAILPGRRRLELPEAAEGDDDGDRDPGGSDDAGGEDAPGGAVDDHGGGPAQVAHLWLRVEEDQGPGAPSDRGPRALRIPDLADVTGRAGDPPRGPATTPPDPVCQTREVLAASGRTIKLTAGELQRIDPGTAPGEPEPEAPAVDQHGHPIGRTPSTARGGFYRMATFLCDPLRAGRPPMVLDGQDLVLAHQPGRSGEEVGPALARVSPQADERWSTELRDLLPEGDADLEEVRLFPFLFRLIRGGEAADPNGHGHDHDASLLTGIVWRRGAERRLYLTALDPHTGEARYLARLDPKN